MSVSWLVVLLAVGVVGILVLGFVVFGIIMMIRSGNQKSDGFK